MAYYKENGKSKSWREFGATPIFVSGDDFTRRKVTVLSGQNASGAVLPACDASLASAGHSTYVRGADGIYSRLCRVQRLGATSGPLNSLLGIQRFSASPLVSAARGQVQSGG